MAQKSVSWEEFSSLKNKYVELESRYDALSDKLKKYESSNNSKSSNEHSAEFWIDVWDKLKTDPDFIKGLVKNKILTMFDKNNQDQTLLIMAGWNGSYEIVQLCLNSGADINAKDCVGKTALDWSKENGHYHVEQLLLFAQMNVNVGNEIRNISNTILKQNGVINTILNELMLIGKQSKQLFEKILMELMINIIQRRLSFDDTLLNLCWKIAANQTDPLSSELWKVISSTCSDITQNGNKRDWYWLKKCIVTSTIWFKDMSIETEKTGSPRYLYYELLKLVDTAAEKQLVKLEKDLNVLANKNKNDWNKLIKWDLPDQYEKVRQDLIPNGIVSRYTYNQLSESSGAMFNSPKFYDYNQYLSQLVLLAQIVDDDFQKSLQNIFKIDKVTNIGILHNDDDEKKNYTKEEADGQIKYMRGPVKLIERARHKAQTDYVNEEYPASACVLDLNRCALIFNDISTLLAALQLFVNKIKYYQSGNIIGIVRDKNGFIEYIQETQYADIKLNVLIKGTHNCLIGEVQFLLNTMKQFKDQAHHLYAIQRQRESMETSVSTILPMLLDQDKQLLIAGDIGNINTLCELMVINNKSVHDMMKSDKETGHTILHKICWWGHDRAYSFVKSILSKQEFIKQALAPNVWDIRPIEYGIRFNQVSVTKKLFDIKEIREIYKKKNHLFRLCYYLFVHNKNEDLIDYILNLLNIRNDEVREMMNYQYQQTDIGVYKDRVRYKEYGFHYDKYRIINELTSQSTLKALQKLVSIIGTKVFVDNALIDNKYQENALEIGIRANSLKIIKYMLSFKEIKNQYSKNDNLLFRLIYHLFAISGKEEVIDLFFNELKISNKRVQSLITYKYPAPTQQLDDNAEEYHQYSIMCMVAWGNTLESMKKLHSIIGEQAFVDAVFMKDGWNANSLYRALHKNKLDMIQYMMNVKGIKNVCMDDMDELHSIIFVLNRTDNESIMRFIVKALDLTNAKLDELKSHRNIDITKILQILDE